MAQCRIQRREFNPTSALCANSDVMLEAWAPRSIGMDNSFLILLCFFIVAHVVLLFRVYSLPTIIRSDNFLFLSSENSLE